MHGVVCVGGFDDGTRLGRWERVSTELAVGTVTRLGRWQAGDHFCHHHRERAQKACWFCVIPKPQTGQKYPDSMRFNVNSNPNSRPQQKGTLGRNGQPSWKLLQKSGEWLCVLLLLRNNRLPRSADWPRNLKCRGSSKSVRLSNSNNAARFLKWKYFSDDVTKTREQPFRWSTHHNPTNPDQKCKRAIEKSKRKRRRSEQLQQEGSQKPLTETPTSRSANHEATEK